jgi:hypothetical protein
MAGCAAPLGHGTWIGAHTRRARMDCRYRRCVACTSSMITLNFASGMRLTIEGGVVSEGGNPDVQDEDRSLDTTRYL